MCFNGRGSSGRADETNDPPPSPSSPCSPRCPSSSSPRSRSGPADGVRDAGDPLLNSWILSWVGHQAFRGPLDLFQANIFHPYPGTLAFSEHLLPEALAAAPVEYLTGNSVLAHNFALFLAFVLSGFGTYLLVRRLAGSAGAGLLSGIVFAFSSYKIMHVSHLQLLWSVGIPFFFLFLHRFLDDERGRDAWLFALFLVIQALACVYYGLFSIAVLVLVLPVLLLLRRRRLTMAMLAKLAVPLVPAAGVLVLFSLPYTAAFKNMGLKRELALGAEIQNYLAAFPTNLVWGKLLSGLGSPEKYLFPGLLAVLLAGLALRGLRRTDLPAAASLRNAASRAGRVLRILLAAVAGLNLLSFAAAMLGGLNFTLGPLRISANNRVKPLLYLFLIGLVLLALRVVRHLRSPAPSGRSRSVLAYAVLTAWAMALSFGAGFAFLGKATMVAPMPFTFFHRHVLGFNGVREPVRFAVFVLFGVAVLAGFGAERLFAALRGPRARAAACAALALLINVEFLAWPIDGITVPVGKDIPPTVRWLADEPASAVVLELPVHDWIPDESVYLYFATVHRKTLVNGYSGFIPASTFLARDVFREFPGGESFDFLETLGVTHVVVHAKMLPGGADGEARRRIEACADPRLKLLRRFSYSFRRPNALSNELGEDLVFSFAPAPGGAGERSGRRAGSAGPDSEERLDGHGELAGGSGQGPYRRGPDDRLDGRRNEAAGPVHRDRSRPPPRSVRDRLVRGLLASRFRDRFPDRDLGGRRVLGSGRTDLFEDGVPPRPAPEPDRSRTDASPRRDPPRPPRPDHPDGDVG